MGRAARRWLSQADGQRVQVCVSVVTYWEVALLEEAGRLGLPSGFAAWCNAVETSSAFRVEPLTSGDVQIARDLRALRDPHDRLIAGTALRLGVPLLTADARITDSAVVAVVWD